MRVLLLSLVVFLYECTGDANDGYMITQTECNGVPADAVTSIFKRKEDAFKEYPDMLQECKKTILYSFRYQSNGGTNFEVILSHDNHDNIPVYMNL